MRVAIDIPDDLLQAIRAEARAEALAVVREEVERLRATSAAPPPPPPTPTVRYARIGAYAARVGLGRRKLHELIGDGLPTIGEGRLRRVDVAAADAWLASQVRSNGSAG